MQEGDHASQSSEQEAEVAAEALQQSQSPEIADGTNKDTEATVGSQSQVEPPDSLPTPPESNVASPEDYPSSTPPTVATPCDEDERTVVDIHSSFKVGVIVLG